jgi:hypothetical protein
MDVTQFTWLDGTDAARLLQHRAVAVAGMMRS